ncbi:MAG: 6-phosphofructokinase [Fimbriimonadaceae bacterium]|nr:6-phosphofructokinase [Fimbriimonadaceae bacterium]NUM39407.1 6-phosphofructokinase [Armatimonadota bacterium]
MKRIGVLTGGGDVPGLNPCIKAVAHRAIDDGLEVLGIRRGWAGLLNYNPDDPEDSVQWTVPLHKANTRTIDRFGGTFLHTSRTNPCNVAADRIPGFLKGKAGEPRPDGRFDFTRHILKNLEVLELDALVTIGGDDTLSYSYRLHTEGFPVVAIPKTMDNDVFGTDYCIGFSTAVTRSVDFITALRTPTGSHERICIVELFGRNSGETSLISAYLAGVDRAVISEVPFDPLRLAEFLVRDKRNNPSNYAVMTISEGAQMIGGSIVECGQADEYGHRKLGGIGAITGDAIKELTGENIIYQQLAYLMRSGEPDALDRMVAISFGNLAADLLQQGVSGKMTALRDGKYAVVPLDVVHDGTKRVDVSELYDASEYRPKVAKMFGKPMFLY